MFGIIKRKKDFGHWLVEEVTEEKFKNIVANAQEDTYEWAQLYNDKGEAVNKRINFDKMVRFIMSDKNPVIDKKGDKCWYKDGKRHRTDGPAVEKIDGGKEWYQNGELHRIDGPAHTKTKSYKAWFVNGKLHRIDGPAMEYANGNKSWYLNGKKHRIDGPAIEWTRGKEWYLYDIELSEELFLQLTSGDIKDLPLYMGRGFDKFIAEKLSGKQ